MENQRQSESKKYYIPLPKTEDAPTGYIEFYRDFQFVEVSEEVYRTYYQPIWRTWDNAKYHKTCSGDDWRRCLGDCAACKYSHHMDNAISHDTVIDESEGITIADTVKDPSPLIDEIMAQNATLEYLLNALAEIDPDGRRIGELMLEGKSGREISRVLGIAHTTYLRRLSKVQAELRKHLEKIF